MRYTNIWFEFIDRNTVNCGIGGDKIQMFCGKPKTSPYQNRWNMYLQTAALTTLSLMILIKYRMGFFVLRSLSEKKIWSALHFHERHDSSLKHRVKTEAINSKWVIRGKVITQNLTQIGLKKPTHLKEEFYYCSPFTNKSWNAIQTNAIRKTIKQN